MVSLFPYVMQSTHTRKTLLPSEITASGEKVSSNVVELISQTVAGLLKVADETTCDNLRVIAKFGLDSPGQHKAR